MARIDARNRPAQQCAAVGSKNAIVAARRKCYRNDMGSLHDLTRSGALRARPSPDEETGRVVPLRPRLMSRAARRVGLGRPPVEDIGKYEGGREDDYRHRMLMNVLGFLTCAILVAAGVWIANSIAELRSHQDCVFSGRHDCAHIDVPSRVRP